MTIQDWHEPLAAFLDRLGLQQTTDTLRVELLTFSTRRNQAVVLDELQRLQAALGTFLGTSSTQPAPCQTEQPAAGSSPTSAAAAAIPIDKVETTTQNSAPAKRAADESNQQQQPQQPRDAATQPTLRHLESDLVQVRADAADIDDRIDHFRALKRREINASNEQEFFRPETRRQHPHHLSCARVDMSGVNRSIQMKQEIVNNEDGPLMQSVTTTIITVTEATAGGETAGDTRTVRRPAEPLPTAEGPDRPYSGLEERLDNLREHLGVKFTADHGASVYERVKALEDRLLFLERELPEWSLENFAPSSDAIMDDLSM
ncbi:hypothetical protein IWQ60_003316 [Tieghemiomyces parasiticus]|uniref:Uncharacterized protein n=1 Tax=Tieghemiomyces parasiticus TaxID=78921 RepID=A0A9W8E073_9FUNG|nr:hypothetical protein IWQ60_003316 [Tieghemiomyces parasiticus]